MDLKERATNLEENYAELRGYAYLTKLFLDDLARDNIDLGADRQAVLDSLSSFGLQKVSDLQFDIKHLVENVMCK